MKDREYLRRMAEAGEEGRAKETLKRLEKGEGDWIKRAHAGVEKEESGNGWGTPD